MAALRAAIHAIAIAIRFLRSLYGPIDTPHEEAVEFTKVATACVLATSVRESSAETYYN